MLREVAAAHEATALRSHQEASARWRAAWQPAEVEPADPAEMREWLGRREAILRLNAGVAEADNKAGLLARRHDAAWSPLAALLPAEAAAAGGRLAALVRAAGIVCAEREAAEQATARAATALKAAEEAAARTKRSLDAAEKDAAEWRSGWARTVAGLGLAADAAAADGKLALELWQQVETASAHWRTANLRVAEMAAAIETFADDAAQTALRAAAELADLPAEECAAALARRLADARAAAQDREKLAEQRTRLNAAIQRSADEVDRAEQALTVLRNLAGAADDAQLQQAIAEDAHHAVLAAEIAARTAELHKLDDGSSRSELDAQAADCDLDALPDRIAAIDVRLAAIGASQVARAVRLAELRAALHRMEQGQDAAGAAQAMHDAMAETEEIAARYARLRLAHMLLRAGIDRFRAQ